MLHFFIADINEAVPGIAGGLRSVGDHCQKLLVARDLVAVS
jgi:hypothetical protein